MFARYGDRLGSRSFVPLCRYLSKLEGSYIFRDEALAIARVVVKAWPRYGLTWIDECGVCS